MKLKKQFLWLLYPDIVEDNINDLFKYLTDKIAIPRDDFEEKQKDNNELNAREKTKNIIWNFGKESSEYIIN